MFSDPQTVTVNGVALTLPRTSNGATSNTYSDAEGDVQLIIKQNKTRKRYRREIRLMDEKVVANPITGTSAMDGVSVYLVIDEPHDGFSNTEVKNLTAALMARCDDATLTKLLGGEF